MAGMTVTGGIIVPSSNSMPNLAFSSSSLSGDKFQTISFLNRRNSRISSNARRTPNIVSPKAVSDSKNSQTCLDPEASRVSSFFPYHYVV